MAQPRVSDARRRRRRVARFSDDNDTDADTPGQQSPPTPLTEWPPASMAPQQELSRDQAIALIARGAPSHKGYRRPVPHVSSDFYALYAASSGNRLSDTTDRANLHDSMVQLMTLRMAGPGEITSPWSTLEQPSCAFMYGARPGTITLNHWASMASEFPESIALRDSGIAPRALTLEQVFERLRELQVEREDLDEGTLYRTLYKRILRDPDRILSPRKSLEKQITDLILALSRPDWIDFTNPKNQVVTRFIFDPFPEDHSKYLAFFHQLLLSMELNVRIHNKQHSDYAKDKLLQQIPPTIRWDLALARRWSDYIRVESYGPTADDIKLRFKLRKRQVKMLKKFATTLKWPNLGETLDALRDSEDEVASDPVSSHAYAFFSGLVLPGPTFPFIIMNTLIDTDPDEATDDLALLSHRHPNCGFQYRNSYTYWTTTCIVGKVLAPTCQALAGWVGPACPTADLGRSQIALIRARNPKQVLQREDVESMGERSDPLGPPSEIYPVEEYALATPETSADVPPDTARLELLTLRQVPVPDPTEPPPGPKLFDATIQVAVDGVSWPLRLSYDVSFVNAWPCSDGPHPLFFDYIYKKVPADEILGVRDWGGLYSKTGSTRSARSTPMPVFRGGKSSDGGAAASIQQQDDEEVLVVEAFGVPDHEVLVRAWCAHWGASAMVADVSKTCMACAIRECYAAALTVLILVDGGSNRSNE
ncbi:VTC domain-containing protein [Cordyceps javanica]|uniref:VTC domain-containing protein n=1 Tax=Cordyceps javanica TaxID=43265 RepID=A0A545VIM1_9HYPO|nr:VTC domain-containing protein [Cordyceps javanica]TQW01584.1 VTC domain-containing protein [Cordyceps javanica]